MKSMFGLEKILLFLDSLRIIVEKQKDQLKEQISSLDSYDKIQDQMHVLSSDAGLERKELQGYPGSLR